MPSRRALLELTAPGSREARGTSDSAPQTTQRPRRPREVAVIGQTPATGRPDVARWRHRGEAGERRGQTPSDQQRTRSHIHLPCRQAFFSEWFLTRVSGGLVVAVAGDEHHAAQFGVSQTEGLAADFGLPEEISWSVRSPPPPPRGLSGLPGTPCLATPPSPFSQQPYLQRTRHCLHFPRRRRRLGGHQGSRTPV